MNELTTTINLNALWEVTVIMSMIVYMCMSVYMHMSTCITKLMDVLIIYLFSTFVHGFEFKTYMPLSTF